MLFKSQGFLIRKFNIEILMHMPINVFFSKFHNLVKIKFKQKIYDFANFWGHFLRKKSIQFT